MKRLKIIITVIIVAVGALLLSQPEEWLPLPEREKSEERPRSGEGDGSIQLYFSNAYRNDPSVGEWDEGNIDRQLESLIASAQWRIDGALFDLESARIAQALRSAIDRGVEVRLVLEKDHAENEVVASLRNRGVPIVLDNRSGRMHNKFLVIDNRMIWTGSMNVTENGAWKNNNHGVAIASVDLAENYTAEFEEMFLEKSFGPRSPSATPNSLVKLGETDIYTYFSPEDDVQSKILRFIRLAKREIRFMAFSFTDDEIGKLLVERHRAGVDVAGVIEAWGATLESSELRRFRDAGMRVMTDGNSYLMHHKVMVIDGTWTILGSYNFTESAARRNDENVLIIKSPAVAQMMLEEYRRVTGIGEGA